MFWWPVVFKVVITLYVILKKNEEVCYKDAGIGCFNKRAPFDNALGKLPDSPASMAIQYLLYTRYNSLVPQTLTPSRTPLITSYYDGNKKTKIIIHGFRTTGHNSWIKEMTAALLEKEDVNVIVVDWEKGAYETFYSQAAANTRVVGALLAQLITALRLHCNAKNEDMHLIGSSLGAHVAGYVGTLTHRIGRITGLDPAGLYFDLKDKRVRLDPADALFVDVIHTDGERIVELGFGTRFPCGDVDFYPNGGKDQPGCSSLKNDLKNWFKNGFKDMSFDFGCSHLRVNALFTDSIRFPDSFFEANPCTTYTEYSAGNCPCNGKCVVMGYNVDTNAARGKYFLATSASSPYSLNR